MYLEKHTIRLDYELVTKDNYVTGEDLERIDLSEEFPIAENMKEKMRGLPTFKNPYVFYRRIKKHTIEIPVISQFEHPLIKE